MRVLCRYGHYAFYPRRAGDINRFAQSFGVTLERERDFYTFPELKDAPTYSLAAKPYLNLPALKTFEGEPWDIMRENDFVYSISLKMLVPKLAILGVAEITQKGFLFIANAPILQAGVRTTLGRQVMSYSGEFYEDGFYLRISEFTYE